MTMKDKGPYQIRRSKSKYNTLMGEYTHALLDMNTPQPNDYGFRVVTTMQSNSPIAPNYLRRRQAVFNSTYMLNQLRVS